MVGILIGSRVFDLLTDSSGSSSLESVHGFDLVSAVSTHGGSMVAVIDGAKVGDPAVQKAVTAAARRVGQVPGVSGVVTAYGNPDPLLRARDGRASLLPLPPV